MLDILQIRNSGNNVPRLTVGSGLAELLFSTAILGELKQLKLLVGYGIKSKWQIFKTQMLIYHSKANLDVKILFGKSTHLINPKIWKAGKGLYGNGDSIFDSCP